MMLMARSAVTVEKAVAMLTNVSGGAGNVDLTNLETHTTHLQRDTCKRFVNYTMNFAEGARTKPGRTAASHRRRTPKPYFQLRQLRQRHDLRNTPGTGSLSPPINVFRPDFQS
jgi:hypothetical protein